MVTSGLLKIQTTTPRTARSGASRLQAPSANSPCPHPEAALSPLRAAQTARSGLLKRIATRSGISSDASNQALHAHGGDWVGCPVFRMGCEGKEQRRATTEQMIALIPQPIAWTTVARGNEKPPTG